MAAVPETVTFVIIFNESDFFNPNDLNAGQPLYVHGYTDIVLLSIMLIISFLCNILVIATVVSHRYLRQTPFYTLLMLLASVFLIDCLLNGSLSLAYMSRMVWNMGPFLCQTNTFTIQLVTSVVPWLVVQAAIDRYICLHNSEIYRNYLTVSKQILAAGILLGLTVLGAVPYLAQFLPVRPFPARMACAAANVSSNQQAYIFVVTVMVLLDVIPAVIILIFGVIFAHRLISNRHEKLRAQTRSWLQTESTAFKPLLSHHDTRTLGVWLAMGGYYVVTILPYVVHGIVVQLSPVADEVDSNQWEMCQTPNTDAFLAWLRYLANWLHPVAILALHEDIRHETMVLLTAWNSASVASELQEFQTVGMSRSAGKMKWGFLSLGRREKVAPSVQSDVFTPVLFPSPHGLFLRNTIGKGGNQFEYNYCDNFAECCNKPTKPKYHPKIDSGYGSRKEVQEIVLSDTVRKKSSQNQSLARPALPRSVNKSLGENRKKKISKSKVTQKNPSNYLRSTKLASKAKITKPVRRLHPKTSAILKAEPIDPKRHSLHQNLG